MFEVYRTYAGYVYHPNISKPNYQLLINPSLFTSINLWGKAKILRDCDKYLRSVKGSPLVIQVGSVNKPVWSKEKIILQESFDMPSGSCDFSHI